MALSKAEIAEHMTGSCLSTFEGAQQMGISEDEVLEACTDEDVQQCVQCNYWQEPGDYEVDNGDIICNDCACT